MIAHGGADFQVSQVDFDAGRRAWWSKTLPASLFMTGEATMENYMEVYNTPATVDPGVIQDAAQWIWAQQQA